MTVSHPRTIPSLERRLAELERERDQWKDNAQHFAQDWTDAKAERDALASHCSAVGGELLNGRSAQWGADQLFRPDAVKEWIKRDDEEAEAVAKVERERDQWRTLCSDTKRHSATPKALTFRRSFPIRSTHDTCSPSGSSRKRIRSSNTRSTTSGSTSCRRSGWSASTACAPR